MERLDDERCFTTDRQDGIVTRLGPRRCADDTPAEAHDRRPARPGCPFRGDLRGAVRVLAVPGLGAGEPYGPGPARIGCDEPLGPPSRWLVGVRDLRLGLFPPDFYLAVPRRGEAAPAHIGGDRRVIPPLAP